MHSITVFVLVFALVATGWLAYYVRVVLPREFEEKCRQSMKAFSTAVEMRAPLQKGLAKRIATISREVGHRRGLPKSALIDIELASHLRGIGLCALPYSVLNVSNPNQWTAAETYMYSKHSEISAAMVDLVPALKRLKEIMYSNEQPQNLVALESREIIELVAEYVWTERWNGSEKARSLLTRKSETARDPQITRDLFEVLPHASEQSSFAHL